MWKRVRQGLYERNDKTKYNLLFNVLFVVILLAIWLEIAFCAVYTGIYVVESSMYPTLTGAATEKSPGGDYVYVNKNATPDYGDIVVVTKDDGTTIIKRVVALGGDYVRLDHGVLYVKFAGTDSFELVKEEYVAPENNTPTLLKNTFPRLKGGAADEDGFYVEEDCMFLLGDNRDVSVDSREGGGINFSLSQLYGVVTDWSMSHKEFFTSLHRYFYFDLPRYFGFA